MKERILTLTPLLALLLLTAVVAPTAKAAETQRPNVVLILIDDLSHFSMPAYGAVKVATLSDKLPPTPVRTPQMDRLAASGLRCDQAYVHALCENTRVALMTGMHNGRNYIQPKALHASQITFSDVFKRAGYATGMYGKWKQTRGTPEIPAKRYISEFGWDDYSCFDVVGENRRYLEPDLVINGEVRRFRDAQAIDPVTGRRAYGPDICDRAALRFIEDHKSGPFFLYCPLMLVHDEHTPTPDTQPAAAYDNFRVRPDGARRAGEGDDQKYFPDMLAYTDKMIGNVIQKLDQLGLRDNTLVVIMGDNGTKEAFRTTMEDGTVRDGGKGRTKDSGEHVGLIFNWPGRIPSGPNGAQRTYDGLIDVVDIYPTLFDACGITVPNADKIDGISVWPQVMGRPNGLARQAIYHWYNANNTLPDQTQVLEYAFTKDFKRYAPHDTYANGRCFDLRSDLDEMAGGKGRQASWKNWFHSGLDQHALSAEQQAAFAALGEVLGKSAYVPVKDLHIAPAKSELKVGEQVQLDCRIEPPNATRNNVIWDSSDPAVASVDKFGLLTAHKAGTVRVSVYSWDDAHPVANGSAAAFSRKGISNTIRVLVR